MERQQSVVRTAYEVGYYDYPRIVTQKEVAAVFDIAGSTAVEHLRKDERAVVKQALSALQGLSRPRCSHSSGVTKARFTVN